MCVRLLFSPPLVGSQGEAVSLPLPADKAQSGVTLREALEHIGLSAGHLDGTLDPELSALVVLNGRALSHEARFDTIVRGGDVVSFHVMLTGG